MGKKNRVSCKNCILTNENQIIKFDVKCNTLI